MSNDRNNLINNLLLQYRSLEKSGESMDKVSWGYEQGILISGNDAKELVEIFKELTTHRRRYYGNKPRKL